MKNSYSGYTGYVGANDNINIKINKADSYKNFRPVVLSAFILVMSVLFSQIKIFNSFSPFGLSFAVSLPSLYFYVSLAGNLFGYIFLGDIYANLIYIVALLIAAGIRILFLSRVKTQKKIIFYSLISSTGILIAGFYFIITDKLSPAEIIFTISEAMATGALTFFFASAAPAVLNRKSLSECNIRQVTGIIIIFMLVLIALSPIQIPKYFHLGVFLSTIIIFVSISSFDIAGGVSAAVLTNLALSLYDLNLALQTGIMITAAFFSGLFKPVGKYAQVIVFAGFSVCCMLILGPETVRMQSFLSIMFGCLAFMALPGSFTSGFSIVPQREKLPAKAVKQRLSARLDFNAKALLDIQKSVSAVSKKLNKISSADISSVYKKTTGKVCKNCGLNRFCWETAYDETMSAINEITKILRGDGVLTHENAPYHYRQKCCKLDRFIEMLNHQYRSYILTDSAERMIRESRFTIIEQFEGIADMLSELGREIEDIRDFDEEDSAKILEFFYEQGYPSAEAYVYTDKLGHIHVEVYFEQALQTDPKILSSHISDRLSREFDIPSCVTVENGGCIKTRLSFFERADYSVDFCAGQISADNNKLCGDSYEFFLDSNGFSHMILSDGMGNGARAAVDSIMTCSLLLRLIKAGFGYDAALKLINTSIISKSHDESFATLDAACLDLYTGNLEILKAGGAASLIYKNGSFIKIEGNGLPVGILQGISFDRKKTKVSDGDIVVMVSDGALATGIEWLEAEIELYRNKTAEEISSILCSGANKRRVDGRSDDITIMVMKIEKGV